MPYQYDSIETERCILRPFEAKDIGPSYEMNLNAEVSKYTGDGGVVSRAEIERRIKEHVWGDYQKHGYGRLAIEWKANGQFIGFAGLKYLEDLQEVDLGYRLMQAYWGKGIGTEVARASLDLGFNTLQLNKIIAMVIPENIASVKVLEKLNFTFDKEVLEEGIIAHLYSVMKERYI